MRDEPKGWGRLDVPNEWGAKTGARTLFVEPWAWALLKAHAATCTPGSPMWGPNGARYAGDRLRDLGTGFTFTSMRRAKSKRLRGSLQSLTEKGYEETMGHSAETAIEFYQQATTGDVFDAHKGSMLGRPPRGIEVVLGSNLGIQSPEEPDGG